jgi:hypothetical protein
MGARAWSQASRAAARQQQAVWARVRSAKHRTLQQGKKNADAHTSYPSPPLSLQVLNCERTLVVARTCTRASRHPGREASVARAQGFRAAGLESVLGRIARSYSQRNVPAMAIEEVGPSGIEERSS